ncbi:MAG: WD40 repeat domain-containing protein, partial [Gemmatimonadaceae bacterium]
RLGFSIGPEGAIVWDLATQRSLRAIRPVSGTFSKGIFLRDNAHLATVTSDGVLQLWALDAARRMFAGTAAGHLGAALSPRGARYIVSANEREGARLWPTDGSGATWEIGVASRLASIPAFTPDESRLAMMWGDGEVTEFDVEKRRKTWESKAHAIGGAADASLASKKGALSYSTVSETGESALATKGEVQYSADGKVLMAAAFMREQNSRASSRLNARIRVYQVGTSAAPRELDIVRNATYVALSPDSRAIAVALANGEVREYDLAKSSWATRVLPNGAGVVALGYRPDGSLFVARGNELLVAPPPQASRRGGGGSIPVPSRTLASAAASLSSFAVSANKPYIAFGDSVGNAEVWDVDANRRLCSLPTVHSDRVASLAFAPSGAILATGSADRSVAMSSIDGPLGCRFLYRIQPNEQQVMGVAFKQSAPPFLVVTNAGGVARLYERALWAPRDSLVALALKRLGGRKLSAAERREYKLRPSP